MYLNTEIAKDIYYVGVNDRIKHKFENMLPLPYGVSYNSYLIVDEKVALVDTVEISFGDVFIDKIQSQLRDRQIDYLIINHMEPDHSGSLSLLRKYYPNVTLVGNKKTLEMVQGYYGIDDNTLEVSDGEILKLGTHVLQFHLTPMVHWPETMMTYDESEKVLFSGDAFGCFGTLDGGVIDSEMNLDKYWDEMYRYYANIVGKYGAPVQKALQKLTPLDIKIICSTHGPVWKEQTSKAVDIYDQLSRYEAKEGVVVVYGSMYGNTERMAEAVAQGLVQNGIRNVVMHNVSVSDASVILRDIFKYKGLIIGSPTYCNDLYPEIHSLLTKIEIRQVKKRDFAFFGSYSWAGITNKKLAEFGEKMKWRMIDFTVEEKMGLTENNYQACIMLGRKTAELLKTPES
ncbi:MAG TPA: FprA family A-type flavoprotein, partial [Paludibacteraceae bacterium]|nr:FprA family A-type flavoprotein [Paludibacteraceae bacterium]